MNRGRFVTVTALAVCVPAGSSATGLVEQAAAAQVLRGADPA
ncbi:MAG: hypothetical protein ACRCYR_08735 [Phycicoccus sp.]